MIETAVIYIVIAIGKKVLGHAGDDAGDAFDKSLRGLARWVRTKIAGRPMAQAAIDVIAEAPDGKDGDEDRDDACKTLADALEKVTAGDQQATDELAKMVAELEGLAPLERTVEGRVFARKVTDGTVIGAETTVGFQGKTVGIVAIDEGKNVLIIGASNASRSLPGPLDGHRGSLPPP